MGQKILIINADDLGYDPAVTRGILQAMRQGIVSSTTFMVNMEDSEAAAREAKGLSVGLHLNLARGAPVWRSFPKSLLREGQFSEPDAGALPADVVAEEVMAQLDRLHDLVNKDATHIDVHKHLHQHPGVLDGLCRAAQARGVPVRSITAQMRVALRERGVRTNDHFIGGAGPTAYWTLAQLEAELAQIQPGVTELMCHPGYVPERLRSGYSAQREVELQTFLDPRARELLGRAGVDVTDFRVLR